MKRSRTTWAIALTAVGIAGVSFVVQRRLGLDFGDEGFLWYGARQTSRGEVPGRDFQAYDPGRYEWCAAFMRVLRDDGILTLRLACHVCEVAGLAAGLAVIERAAPHCAARSLWGAVALTWMFPLFRTFETALASSAVLVLTRLLERPSRARHVQAGLSIGIAAYAGRNHGVYHAAAYALAFAFGLDAAPRRERMRDLGAAFGGLVVGYSPMLAKLLFVRGFAAALFRSVATLGRTASTNFTLAPPWPLGGGPRPVQAFDLVNGALFVALPVTYAAVMTARAVRGREFTARTPAVFAAACVGLPYLHQAFSRADYYHLASSIHPFLLVLATAPGSVPQGRARTVLEVAALTVAAAFTAVMATKMTPLLRRRFATQPYREVTIGRDRLMVDADCADSVGAARELGIRAGARPRTLYFVTAPALYAVLGRESPLFDIYWSRDADPAHEDRMIADLDAHDVGWIVLDDIPLDTCESRRAINVHRRFWTHVFERFHRVPLAGFPPDVLVLRRDADEHEPPAHECTFDASGTSQHVVAGVWRSHASEGRLASSRVPLKLGVPPGAEALHVDLAVDFEAGGAPPRLRCVYGDGTSAESGPLAAGLHAVAFELPAAVRASRSALFVLETVWTTPPLNAGRGPGRGELCVRLIRAALR